MSLNTTLAEAKNKSTKIIGLSIFIFAIIAGVSNDSKTQPVKIANAQGDVSVLGVKEVAQTNWEQLKITNPDLEKIDFPEPPKPEPTPEPKVDDKTELPKPSEEFLKVKSFVENYGGGKSRLKGQFLEILNSKCDIHTLKVAVAISTHETGQGSATPWRKSNFWGWFAGGNKNHDPDMVTMAEQICHGLSNYYPNLVVNGKVNYNLAVRYTGNDRPSNWVSTVEWALNSMK